MHKYVTFPWGVTKKFLCVLAKIETRPGQVGECNGYILEGKELDSFKNNLNVTKNP